jgi:hypothetical protein
MAWEKRGNGLYYYRKRREGRRIVSEYIGIGELAEAIAAFDSLDRQEREVERQRRQRELDRDRGFARDIDAVCELIRGLTTAVMLATGHHTHKGTWRRRRE